MALHRIITLALALLAASGTPSDSFAQESPRRPARARGQDQENELDKLVRVAKSGRTAFRPQAARRLLEHGAAAADRLVIECGDTNAELAALGSALVEVLGEFGDARLDAKAWAAIDDPDFPWRPAATRGLSVAPAAATGPRFEALCSDPLAAVRKAAIEALANLPAADSATGSTADFDRRTELMRARLADPEGRVRRAAAVALAKRGERGALWWLFAELERNDRFLDRPDGKLARYDAARDLEPFVTELEDFGGYDAELDANGNADALARIEAALTKIAGAAPDLPPIARPSAVEIDAVFGIELRSCRVGELFLRWDRREILWVGTGNPARVDLEPGTVGALITQISADLGDLEDQRFWGRPGCDMEQFHARLEPGGATQTLVVAKGPEPVESLRPEAFTRLMRRLTVSIPNSESSDPRLKDLARRVRASLAVLGGPVD